MNKVQYTITFDKEHTSRFRAIVDRLDPDEFTVITDIAPVDPESTSRSNRDRVSTVMTMVPEAALTFRLGMKDVTIKKLRTEEEEAEMLAAADRHKIKITVKVPGLNKE